jgi:hypothetical protein
MVPTTHTHKKKDHRPYYGLSNNICFIFRYAEGDHDKLRLFTNVLCWIHIHSDNPFLRWHTCWFTRA